MAQLARERGLVLEEAQLSPRGVGLGGKLLHHLDCDIGLAEWIRGEIDGPGRALAALALDLVLADALEHQARGTLRTKPPCRSRTRSRHSRSAPSSRASCALMTRAHWKIEN